MNKVPPPNTELVVKSENGQDFETIFTGTGQALVNSIAVAILTGATTFGISASELLSDVTKQVLDNAKD